VENEIYAFTCLAGSVEIEDAHLAEVDATEYFGEILAPAGGEVIDAAHFIAPTQKGTDQ